jgi:hypothetical protein
MARTPLFRFLRRALALARAADAGRVSAAEAVELDRTGRLSRRELLAGTAVTATCSTAWRDVRSRSTVAR